MTKPLGYYHLGYEHQLIQDIADTWGDNLESLTEADRYWLIATLAEFYFLEISADYSELESDVANELYLRFPLELNRTEKDCLILALGNASRGQPLGYWGLPPASYENQLIIDVIETWGESLGLIGETDQYYLLTKLARSIWYRDFNETHDAIEALEELSNRCDELPRHQIYCLIRALINK